MRIAVLAAILAVLPQEALSPEEKREIEEYLDAATRGPFPCPPSSIELIHRYGADVVPYLALRMVEEPRYRSTCARLLSVVAGQWGSMDEKTEKALIGVLKEDGSGAPFAAGALGSVGSERALPELMK